MGSDGLFDNIHDQDLIPCLKTEIKKDNGRVLMQSPEAAATCLAKLAYNKSKDQTYESPFAVSAKKARRWYRGGKEDDITVIVA